MNYPQTSLLRKPKVLALTGLSTSTLYLRIKQGLFPKPVALGERSVAWIHSEIEAINQARIQGKTDEEIRFLVQSFQKTRSTFSSQEAHE